MSHAADRPATREPRDTAHYHERTQPCVIDRGRVIGTRCISNINAQFEFHIYTGHGGAS